MDNSTSENESLSEVEILRQQLTTYKSINADLSKKVQELKVEINLYKLENAQIKKDIIEERTKSAEYQRYFHIINRRCADFVNSYVSSIEEIGKDNLTLVEGIENRSRDDSPRSPIINPNTVIHCQREVPKLQTVRTQLDSLCSVDENTGTNLLNTIVEESMVTSTPIFTERIQRPATNNQNHFPHVLSPTSNCNESLLETPKFSQARRISTRNERIEEKQNKENENEDFDKSAETSNQTVKKVHGIKDCLIALSPLAQRVLRSSTNIEEASVNVTENNSIADGDMTNNNRTRSKRLNTSKNDIHLPVRRARPSREDLKEPSLKTKMRRSASKKLL